MVQNILMDQHLQKKLPFVKKIRFTGKLQKQDNAENQLLHLAEMWTISIEMLPQQPVRGIICSC